MGPLEALEVLVVDCQATAAGERGRLLEVGWARVGRAEVSASARLIRLPVGERVPPAVARITGLTDRVVAGGVAPEEAWRELATEAAALTQRPAPAVAHFARFERPFLERLAGGALPLDLVCTHDIAVRLFPGLPRRSLRALAGYFGRPVTALRRSAEHVAATAFVWRQLLGLLEGAGVRSWVELRAWLARPVEVKRPARREWPMPRELRLSLPSRPGLYRMLRGNGDVLYVGKAASLHHRVNSYFRKQHGVSERTLEMLSQARGLSFELTESPLEAALLEPDEIKRHRPPYNVALTAGDREVWFAAPDLTARAPAATRACPLGPFPSPQLLDQLLAATRGAPTALGPERYAPSRAELDAGLAVLRGWHPEPSAGPGLGHLLRLGRRLWAEGRRGPDDDEDLEPRREWTPEVVASALEWLALRGALAVRRARWLTRLVEATVVFTEPGVEGARLLVVEAGELRARATVARDTVPPVPAGHRRTSAERHQGFSVARLDRLRVLTTELKRLVAERHPVAVRLGPGALFRDEQLARVLGWL